MHALWQCLHCVIFIMVFKRYYYMYIVDVNSIINSTKETCDTHAAIGEV